MASQHNIQLCGHLVVRLDGERVEERLPGAQGRMLFGLLASNRGRFLSRAEMIEALWGERLPSEPDAALRALLSKLRSAVGPDRVEGKGGIRLMLPPDAPVDVEVASEAIHAADAAVAQQRWKQAWAAGHIAVNIARRPFLAGLETPWIDAQRHVMDEINLRGLEALAAAGVGIGGPELDLAERAARSLLRIAPFRESGHRLLMRALAAKGNVAEALLAYDSLRERLRDELGTAPGPELQALHADLLGGSGSAT